MARPLRRLRSSLALALLALAAGSCREEPGAAFACTCTYLTDFDDEIRLDELVCAASADRAAGVASGCAARRAAAPMQGCRCASAPGATRCPVGACLSPVPRD
jgi:hypothetical protein